MRNAFNPFLGLDFQEESLLEGGFPRRTYYG